MDTARRSKRCHGSNCCADHLKRLNAICRPDRPHCARQSHDMSWHELMRAGKTLRECGSSRRSSDFPQSKCRKCEGLEQQHKATPAKASINLVGAEYIAMAVAGKVPAFGDIGKATKGELCFV